MTFLYTLLFPKFYTISLLQNRFGFFFFNLVIVSSCKFFPELLQLNQPSLYSSFSELPKIKTPNFIKGKKKLKFVTRQYENKIL